MSTMMDRVTEFVERNGMSEEVKREMLEILNESLLEISAGIMESREVNVKDCKKVKVEVKNVEKRYKSKKAEEYAEEHGLSLEDFVIREVSKKDVEVKVREITKNKTEVVVKKEENKKEVIKREKVICSGINKKGEACKSMGTIQPDGAKKKYCFRHAEDYRTFECDSDSSDEEKEKENESEKELSEEEYEEKV
jgi:hypothetical protein